MSSGTWSATFCLSWGLMAPVRGSRKYGSGVPHRPEIPDAGDFFCLRSRPRPRLQRAQCKGGGDDGVGGKGASIRTVKFAVAVKHFPNPRNIFLVKFHRELVDKSPYHRSILLRNSSPTPKNLVLP
jgi:hypothetical protein